MKKIALILMMFILALPMTSCKSGKNEPLQKQVEKYEKKADKVKKQEKEEKKAAEKSETGADDTKAADSKTAEDGEK